jgi:hypothetical protein
MSPTTPPPRAISVVERSQRRCSRRVEDRVEGLPVLELLAIGQDDLDDLDSGPTQRSRQAMQVQRRDGAIADDRHFRLTQKRQQQVGARSARARRESDKSDRPVQPSTFPCFSHFLESSLQDRLHRDSAAADDQVGNLAVERVALRVQFAKLLPRVTDLQ